MATISRSYIQETGETERGIYEMIGISGVLKILIGQEITQIHLQCQVLEKLESGKINA